MKFCIILILGILCEVLASCNEENQKHGQIPQKLELDSISVQYSDVRQGKSITTSQFSCFRSTVDSAITFRYDKRGSKFLNISSIKFKEGYNPELMLNHNAKNQVVPLSLALKGEIYFEKPYVYYVCLNANLAIDAQVYYIVTPDFGLLSTGSWTWKNYAIMNSFNNGQENSKIVPMIAEAHMDLVRNSYEDTIVGTYVQKTFE